MALRTTATRRKVAPRKALGVVKRKAEAELYDASDPLYMSKKAVETLNEVRAKKKPLEKREDELSTEIKLWGVGVYPGFTTAIEVFDQPGEGFDMDKFKAENPELHAKYKTDKPRRIAKTVPLVPVIVKV